MAPPGNGIFVVRGEMSTLMTAMKRGARWSSNSYHDDEQDNLSKQFVDLKALLIQIEDLRLIDPNVFLTPFLDVIRSEETTGPVTSLALSAVNKFLSYGLIDPTHSSLPTTVENIADAVTHARFVGTDQASDGVVLLKIVQVLRTLMLSPEGSALTNEYVCEIMLSCFRICFEPRLNELLRRTAEHAMRDIVLLLFMRLPQFAEDRHSSGLIRKLKMIASTMDSTTSKKKRHKKLSSAGLKPTMSVTQEDVAVEKAAENVTQPITPSTHLDVPTSKLSILATTPATPAGNIVDMQGKITQTPTSSIVSVLTQCLDGESEFQSTSIIEENSANDEIEKPDDKSINKEGSVESIEEIETDRTDSITEDGKNENFTNAMGVRFIPQRDSDSGSISLIPYGLPCVQELLRFIVSLCNPLDKQNTDTMIHMGLSLLTVALEVGADSIGKFESLIKIVKDEMCRNLFALLTTERLTIFAANLQVCFLLFESLRVHLKFHMEYYLTKVAEIIGSENPRTPYEIRELALDNLLQFWRIPGFAVQLYINFDCNLYCTNLLEILIKLLSKNSLSATQQIHSIHQISLDTLLTIVDSIEKNCVASKMGKPVKMGRHSRNNSNTDSIVTETQPELRGKIVDGSFVDDINNFFTKSHIGKLFSNDELADIRYKKRILTQGTELFNQKPDKGIQFLQENNLLKSNLEPSEVAKFLRENSGLDKKMIGEFVSKKKNVENKILEAFVCSFDFTNTQIDVALRQYLETFRLPGEAPLIFLVIEHFADHWHKCNNEPFANSDAAFRLAYAIIMLNMDQHNHNAKRLNVPMTVEDFVKNLRGLNGNSDFDSEMLNSVFKAIKEDEIIMPAEQTGLVRENYLWKVLLRRNATKDGYFHYVEGGQYDKDIFHIVWGPTLSTLSFMFDKSIDNTYHKSIIGFTKAATIAAHYQLHEDFDALVLTVCKFTTLLNVLPESNDITTSVAFGGNAKAQLAMKTVFGMVHEHGDCVRDGWKLILELVLQLFKLKLLPKSLMEVEDFCEPNGKATLLLDKPLQKTEASIFSSLYSYLSSEGQRQPSYEELDIIKMAKRCIKECQLDQIIAESKFLQYESLNMLLKSLINMLKPPNVHKSVGMPYPEDVVVFVLELLVKILIQNRDRMLSLWTDVRDQIYLLLIGSSSCGYTYLLNRTTIALLKLAIYLMRNEELCPLVLQSLKMLLLLKPNVIYGISKQISIGMYELLKTSAQNIHTETDWNIVFTLLECVGAGAVPPEFEETVPSNIGTTKSDGALSSEDEPIVSSDRGYTSDSELMGRSDQQNTNSPIPTDRSNGDNWILVNKDSDMSRPTSPDQTRTTLIYPCKLGNHSPFAMVKCWDSLAFIVRNVAHITPYNFENCVKCIRTFVEASLNGGRKLRKHSMRTRHARKRDKQARKREDEDSSGGDVEDDDLIQRYDTIAIQLLDLMHTLHTRTAQIFRWWAEEGGDVPQCSALWAQGWCPLLQGIARLVQDKRKQVRTSAVTCLQRALLVHDLQTLSGPEWASCFKLVLFPLLMELLSESSSIVDGALLEESRVRTATIMSKVFLHHLTPLMILPGFSDLWLEILDFIEKFMKIGSDMLYEAILESLKNMLLVMHSVRIFHTVDGVSHTVLWDVTWKRIGEFLPGLKEELFKENETQSVVTFTEVNSNNSSQQFPVDLMCSPIENNVIGTSKASIILQPPNIEREQNQITLIMGQPSSVPQPLPILCPQLNNQIIESNQDDPRILKAAPSSPILIPTKSLIDPSISPILSQNPQSSFSPTLNDFVTIKQSDINSIQALPVGQHHIDMGDQSDIDSDKVDQVVVPLSHRMPQTQYPSISKVPTNIAQSFAPIFVQPVTQPLTEDIYNDYVKNPYNLTLHSSGDMSVNRNSVEQINSILNDDAQPELIENEMESQLSAPTTSFVFQSANYFGNDTNDSEFLFSRP